MPSLLQAEGNCANQRHGHHRGEEGEAEQRARAGSLQARVGEPEQALPQAPVGADVVLVLNVGGGLPQHVADIEPEAIPVLARPVVGSLRKLCRGQLLGERLLGRHGHVHADLRHVHAGAEGLEGVLHHLLLVVGDATLLQRSRGLHHGERHGSAPLHLHLVIDHLRVLLRHEEHDLRPGRLEELEVVVHALVKVDVDILGAAPRGGELEVQGGPLPEQAVDQPGGQVRHDLLRRQALRQALLADFREQDLARRQAQVRAEALGVALPPREHSTGQLLDHILAIRHEVPADVLEVLHVLASQVQGLHCIVLQALGGHVLSEGHDLLHVEAELDGEGGSTQHDRAQAVALEATVAVPEVHAVGHFRRRGRGRRRRRDCGRRHGRQLAAPAPCRLASRGVAVEHRVNLAGDGGGAAAHRNGHGARGHRRSGLPPGAELCAGELLSRGLLDRHDQLGGHRRHLPGDRARALAEARQLPGLQRLAAQEGLHHATDDLLRCLGHGHLLKGRHQLVHRGRCRGYRNLLRSFHVEVAGEEAVVEAPGLAACPRIGIAGLHHRDCGQERAHVS
mmetsp:Transcript_10109/g.29921  ORF Transcript_10109/g.29921 Transcript_10109/m.29921 type:complete len:565 (-) Transcript_10109:71-1765(-)